MDRGAHCVYELTTKAKKDALVQENKNLQVQNAQLEASNEALERIKDEDSSILDILTNNGHIDEIIRRLRAGDERTSIAGWLHRQPELQAYMERTVEKQVSLNNIIENVEKRYQWSTSADASQITTHRWTEVTSSQPLIQHLFELYFTWVHPNHMLFAEGSFLESYHSGDGTYCSSALVNAICAMSCHLLDSPAPGVSPRDVKDSTKLRAGFMAQARSTLKPARRLSMPSLQAFSVMFLVDLSSGNARSAAGYLRCAADHLTAQGSADQDWTREYEITQWGIHTLNT